VAFRSLELTIISLRTFAIAPAAATRMDMMQSMMQMMVDQMQHHAQMAAPSAAK